MKRPSRRPHAMKLLTIVLFAASLLYAMSGPPPSAADGLSQDVWRVEVEEGRSARSTPTINNRCSAPHLFRVRSDAKFFHFEEQTNQVPIEAGSGRRLGVRLDATGFKGRALRGRVVIECVDCKKEHGCKQERDKLPIEMVVIGPRPAAPPPVPGSVKGRVVNPRNEPVVGVQVRVPARDAALTNDRGEFNLVGLPATERLPVSFSARSFMDTTKIYNTARLSIGTSVVVIWPRRMPALLDADRGGRLTFPDGSVSFPPRSLADERGRAVRGKVRVSLSALDVSDRQQLRSAPGDFTARMRDNSIRQLETFGVFEVFVETADGRRADLARGQSVTVELAIPEKLRRNTPEAVGLFSFDQKGGRWVEEGRLRRTPSRATLVTSLSTVYPVWNADQPLDTTCLKVQVVDQSNQPVQANTPVEAEGADYYGISPVAYTDGNGVACLLVKRCSNSNVAAYHQSLPDVQSCPQTFTTHCYAADCSNSSACPLEATTVQMGGGAFQEDLNAFDPTRWYKSDGTNYDPNDPTNPFGSGWLPSRITHSGGIMTLQLDDAGCPNGCHNMPYASGEYQSTACYSYGMYEASIKAANKEGVVTTFFTYTGPYGMPGHHEIDIEIKGKQETCANNQPKTVMQANYFVEGKGQHEQLIDLCFDASAAFHTYAFEWRPGFLQWLVDGQVVHTVYRSRGVPLPRLPGKIMVNLWAANSTQGATDWLGTFSYTGTPVKAEYDWIKYTP